MSVTSEGASQQQLRRVGRSVRDEEAAGSNPATPTQVTGHLRAPQVAFFTPYSSKVIWASQSSAESGQPWLKTIGWPEPQSL